MKPTRYATSRQKACQNCSKARVKCDRKAGGCTRCAQRNTVCAYVTVDHGKKQNSNQQGLHSPKSPVSPPDTLFDGAGNSVSTNGTLEDSTSTAPPTHINEREYLDTAPVNTAPSPSQLISLPASEYVGLDFSNLDLICPIDVDAITTRWMNPYIPVPGQKVKQYPPGVSIYIYRILKSYATIAARGRGIPPFVHPSQVSGPSTGSPLTTCLSLIRICANPIPGSEPTVMAVIQREMEIIMQWHAVYDDISLLAAFQSYLIYCLIMFFKLDQSPDNQMRPVMINLQTIAHLSCKKGLICTADQHHTRPRWEEWIVTETKRRTLYVMYLFDSVLSTQEDIPTYLGTELTGLPAAASKSLWQSQSRGIWEREYNVHLAEWTERGLTIDELWPIPEDMDEMNIEKRRRRVDHWLEDIDEFGTMLYAVTTCTHGG